MGEILVALEKTAILLDRCAIYESLYLKTGPPAAATIALERALTGLYAAVLLYLARAKTFYERNTAGIYYPNLAALL